VTQANVAPPWLRAAARAALALEADALLAQCDVDVYTGGGPGGQHRNKTESAVRLTHPPTGVTVTATERRSQHENREVALERLRERLVALTYVPKVRRATRPTKGSQERRLAGKKRDARVKADRRGGAD
jgi:ribosome-associated protein